MCTSTPPSALDSSGPSATGGSTKPGTLLASETSPFSASISPGVPMPTAARSSSVPEAWASESLTACAIAAMTSGAPV